jgi:phage N-6-adenine-methyltransferase
MIIDVGSISGGRTSGYMGNLLTTKSYQNDTPLDLVFMDTGLEAVGTYDFIRNMIGIWELPIKCIRVLYHEEHGKASSYEMLNPESLIPDMVAWKGMLAKYGTPYHPGGARCTDRMKKAPYKQYCKTNFGRGNFRTWLGIRRDEPMRLWGDIVGRALMSHCGYQSDQLADLFVSTIKLARQYSPSEIELCLNSLEVKNTAGVMVRNSRNQEVLLTELIAKGLASKVRENLFYLAEISDYTKEDINSWWEAQEFNLQIEEQLGNCLFCIKKSEVKLALAERDEPEMARLYKEMLLDPSVKIEPHREGRHLKMYRRHKEFGEIIEIFSDFDRDEIASRLKNSKQFESGSCSDACDAFNSDDDLEEEEGEDQQTVSTDFGGSTTPPEHRDSWRTPPALFAAIDAEFSFIGDAAATPQNTLCSRFLTEQQNSLGTDWQQYFGRTGFVWCNPPYSDITPWVDKATKESGKGIGTVMLVPADTSVGWFNLARQACTEVRFITGGRLSFIRADTGKPVNGNNKGSMLIIWNPYRPAAGHTGYVDRDTLMNTGRSIIGERGEAA